MEDRRDSLQRWKRDWNPVWCDIYIVLIGMDNIAFKIVCQKEEKEWSVQ